MISVDDLRRSGPPGHAITHNLFHRRLAPLFGYLSRERDAYAATEAACREDAAHGTISDTMPTGGPAGWVPLWGP